MYKKLTIVSDTAIFCDKGKYFAFGPVVREVENFEYLFEEITWIGFNRLDKQNDLSMQEIKSKKTKLFLIRIVLFINKKNIKTIQTQTKTEKHNNSKKESKISNIIEFAKKNITDSQKLCYVVYLTRKRLSRWLRGAAWF